MNKEILIAIDSLDRYRFFKRFVNPLKSHGYRTHFITALPSIRFRAKNEYVSTTLCEKSTPHELFDITRSLEYLSGETTEDLTRKTYQSFYNATEKILKKNTTSQCFIWNGSRTQSLAVLDACMQKGIPCLFFELSNLPNKIFIDPWGVSSASRIYHDSKILTEIDYLEEKYDLWKNSYLKEKRREKAPRQALKSKSLRLEYIIDLFLQFVLPTQKTTSYKLSLKKLIQRLLPKPKLPTPYANVTNLDYLFFPMQVSNDSQLILHSDINNAQALEIALQEASSQNLALVIKAHPADTSPHSNKLLDEIVDNKHVFMSEKNTLDLIEHARAMIVINSSVGLEGHIIGSPPIKYLGRSAYSNLTSSELKNFIMNYLVDLDYFENNDISNKSLEIVLDRKNLWMK